VTLREADTIPGTRSSPTVRLDLAGFITGWNEAATAFFGHTSQEAIGQHFLFLNGEQEGELPELDGLPPGVDEVQATVSRHRRSGEALRAQLTLRLEKDAEGQPIGLCATYQPVAPDIDPDVRLRLYVSIIEDSTQGVLVTDVAGRIVMVNGAFTRITGYTAQEAIGQTPDILRSGVHDAEFRSQVKAAMEGAGLWLGEIMGRRKNGEVFPQSVCISSVRNEQGEITHAFSIFSDITSHRETESRLQKLANFDTVTGLPNRLLLTQLLSQTLSQAKRGDGLGAVMVLQLQRLGYIYDTLGHEVGDDLMAQAARRLQDTLREQDILARLGHDKLVAALPNLRARDHAGIVAHKLLGLLRPEYVLHGHEVDCPVSIGIAVYPDNGMDTGHLLRCAEIANQRAHESGDSPLAFFSEDMNERATERFRLEGELRHAVGHGELLLYHQPKVSLRNGRIVGAEALLRWRHPRHGLMTPGSFVPVAEDTSLILDIGEWVLHEACRQIRDWTDRGLNMPPLAVNLSARQFDKHLPKRMDAVLTQHGVEPRQLKLEITESLMVRGADDVASIMNELAAMGLGMALDDFGTGYSSLSYLKKFPITTLKIDRSFVIGIPEHGDDCAIARAIVTMGQQLRQEIVAEGVENREQMHFLRSLGCDQLQGFLFSPAVSAEDYERMVLQDVRLPLN
jgi:diguanylate cyclase (GGDEF)-like protein/PAS domain S-box-containing protein